MIISLWQWFVISLIISGACVGVVVGVIFLYLFAIYFSITGKLADTIFSIKKFASSPFDSLRF